MREPKFTPGPWINGYRDTHYPTWDIYTCELARICTLPNLVSEQHEANARLIAASPDLYAACKAALARLIDLGSEQDADTIGPCAATDACRSALRKAEGTA